jgi:hypothetical protein
MSENLGLIEALEPVTQVLQAMKIKFYIGGSVASSFHGASRSTMDVDLVADFRSIDVDHFVSQLQNEYYVSKASINDAIARSSCFNLIHLASSFKVDIFVLKERPFDINSMNRAVVGKIDLNSDFEFPIASPEDTILSKLEWYRLGNEERQWEDVVRVLKVVGEKADRDYMLRNADELNVADLLQKLLKAVDKKGIR